MGEFNVRGSDLKALIKLARKQPVAFAYNPGKGPKDDYFGIDRRKSAEVIMKKTRSEGPGKKVAFGTLTVDGKVMSLTCTKELPAMAKKLKAYFKSEKISLNIRILDPDGNELESEVEEDDADTQAAPTAPQPEATPQAAQPTPEPAPEPQQSAPAATAEPETPQPKPAPQGPDLTKLKKDLSAIGQQIKDKKEAAAPLVPVFKALIERLKSGKTETLEADTQKLAQALTRVKQPAQTPPPEAAPGSAEWAALQGKLTPMLDAAKKGNPAAAAKLDTAWTKISGLAEKQKFDQALAQAAKFEPILQRLGNPSGPDARTSGKKKKRMAGLASMEKRADALMAALAA